MTEPEIEYFATQPNLPKNLLDQVQSLQKQVAEEIERGNTKIETQKQLITKKQQDKNKILKQKLHQLNKLKEELVSKLQSISLQQRQIKILSHKQQQNSHKSKLQKSILTEQQKEKIAKLRKQQKQYESMIKNKISNIMEKVKEKQQEELEEKKFKFDMKRKQRLVKMTEKRKKYAESRSKTLHMLENSRVSIKKQQYIYVKNQEKDKKKVKQREKQINEILRLRKEKQKIDFEEIKQYAQEHQRLLSQKKQEFLFQLKQSEVRRRNKTINYESQFSKRLKSQERMKQLQKIQEINAKREVRERVSNFQSILQEKYRPKCTEQSTFVPKKQVQILQRLTHQQARQKGKQFLKIARKKAKKLTPHQSKIQTSSDKIGPSDITPTTSSSQKYPNYLQQLKKKGTHENLLQRVLKQKRLNSRKMQEVIRWMKKKEQGYNIGPNKSPTKNQYTSAIQKIRILNSLYESQTRAV